MWGQGLNESYQHPALRVLLPYLWKAVQARRLPTSGGLTWSGQAIALSHVIHRVMMDSYFIVIPDKAPLAPLIRDLLWTSMTIIRPSYPTIAVSQVNGWVATCPVRMLSS